MTCTARTFAALLPVILLTSCSRTAPPAAEAASPPAKTESTRSKREVRLTGLVEAVHSSKVQVPQIFGPGGPLTLTHLIRNGSDIKEGDIVATFDATTQIDAARDAQAKYDDLGHQVEQKRAQNRADVEKRALDLKTAEGDLAKAELELKRGVTLAPIKLDQAKVKLEIARKHVESLKKSNAAHDRADAASLRILELQRDRQKVALERAQDNIKKLEIRSTLPGMVAIQDVWRANSRGKPQEGDQLFPRQPLASIFDPKEMAVRCAVGEPDGSALERGSRATVYLDAYPDISLSAHVEFVSPVAASAIGSPIKSFTALIKLDRTDPRVMPDLSAAVVVEAAAPGADRTTEKAAGNEKSAAAVSGARSAAGPADAAAGEKATENAKSNGVPAGGAKSAVGPVAAAGEKAAENAKSDGVPAGGAKSATGPAAGAGEKAAENAKSDGVPAGGAKSATGPAAGAGEKAAGNAKSDGKVGSEKPAAAKAGNPGGSK